MTALEELVAPDLPVAVEAWRVWRVLEHRDTYRLGSVTQPTLWPTNEPLVAECRQPDPWTRRVMRRSPRHGAPDVRCDCGVYGADLPYVGQYLTPALFEPAAARVLGRVALWGTVIECQRGYRASHAYPQLIYVPIDAARDPRRLDELAAALGDYGVPVEVLSERCVEATAAVARLG
jgi:hypothetical protein